MLYLILFIFVVVPTTYALITICRGISIYNDLKQGSKVYAKRVDNTSGNDINYYESSVIVDGYGKKYIDRFTIHPFSKWDVIKGNILSEDEYLKAFD